MNKNHLIALAIISVTALVAYAIYLNYTRFYIIPISNGLPVEVDRLTGKTWVLIKGKKIEQIDESLKTIPDMELSKLTGKLSLSSNKCSGSIYNGTEWDIRQITFNVTVKELDAGLNLPKGFQLDFDRMSKDSADLYYTVRWSRDYTDKVNIAPKTSEDVSFSVTEAQEFGEWTWSIIQAKGFLE
jgi:hypothetical protein